MSYGAYGNAGSYKQHKKAAQKRSVGKYKSKPRPPNRVLDYNKPPSSDDFKNLFKPKHSNLHELFPGNKSASRKTYVKPKAKPERMPNILYRYSRRRSPIKT